MSTSTSPSTNVYSAQPAFPILASSLLPSTSPPPQTSPRPEGEETEYTAAAAPQQDNIHAWNLKADIEDGIPTRAGAREKNVFRCGVVVGFSVLRERRYGNRNGGDDFDEGREWVGEVSCFFLFFSSCFDTSLLGWLPTFRLLDLGGCICYSLGQYWT